MMLCSVLSAPIKRAHYIPRGPSINTARHPRSPQWVRCPVLSLPPSAASRLLLILLRQWPTRLNHPSQWGHGVHRVRAPIRVSHTAQVTLRLISGPMASPMTPMARHLGAFICTSTSSIHRDSSSLAQHSTTHTLTHFRVTPMPC